MKAYRFGIAVGGFVLWLAAAGSVFAQNTIQRENAKPGTPNWQLASPADWPAIEGYASATSVNRGETISFHISSYFPTYQITIYRMGWYGGAGARQVSSVTLNNGVKRAVPSPDPVTGLIECNWPVSHQIKIPNSPDKTDWASGIYLAKLTPSSSTDSFIIFVVRDDSSQATYLYQSTATTSQAYNYWGGKSLYAFNSNNAPARKVSFNRPYGRVNGMGGAGNFFEWEVNFIRFAEREGYDLTYASNLDLHVNPNLLNGHKAFLTAGHDEYWSYQMRAAVQAAQTRGVHLGFFAANEAYWQVRFEPSSTGQPNRTMVAYKEAAQTADPYAIDLENTNDKYITTRFRDLKPIFGVIDPVAQPENAFVGVQYHGDPFWGDMFVSDASSWIFKDAGVVDGTRLSGLLGYETDAIADNGYSPPNLQKVADSPDDWGGSHMATYTTATGSVVVATGSMQWNFGLDSFNNHVVVPAAQQATRNILARFAEGPAFVPAAPILKSSLVNKSVKLSWSQATSGITGETIYRATSASGPFALLTTLGVGTSYTDGSGVSKQTYYYQVSAINSTGESPRSNTVSEAIK